ncbi:MAG TPA: hypothetical protein VHF69_05265 [Candidatus Synoicihabitans sp.]|nr:hypothetical protein [Candidatus Synoicihabitans sp.]
MSTLAVPVPRRSAGSYTPGYTGAKRALLLAGLVLAALGASQLWTPVRLTLFGDPALAEAVRVIKEKPGAPPLVLSDDAQVRAHLELRDRSFVFWNEFRFTTADGKTVEVRAAVGSQLQPLYWLTDADGLPTTDLVYYDPARPERVVFPTTISTWLAPGMLLVLGLGAAAIGAMLLYWARRPIRWPDLGAAEAGAEVSKN